MREDREREDRGWGVAGRRFNVEEDGEYEEG